MKENKLLPFFAYSIRNIARVLRMGFFQGFLINVFALFCDRSKYETNFSAYKNIIEKKRQSE